MRRLLALGLVVLLGTGSAAADTVVRSSVVPEEPWVGQRVVLRVDVLSPDGWAQITRLGELRVENALLVRDDSSGVRLQETIRGVGHTGQRYEFSIYPQAAGPIEMPSTPVKVTVKSWGAGATAVQEERAIPALRFDARRPPGVEKLAGLVSTHRLTARQSWEPEPGDLAVGDALTRTITLDGEDVSAMAYEPLRSSHIPGVGIYPSEPVVSDASTRDGLIGTRKEKLTYVFEQPGIVELPDITYRWWNTRTETLESEVLPGGTFEVGGAVAPDSASQGPPAEAEGDGKKALGMIAIGAGLLAGVWLLLALLRRWRLQWQESEARLFGEFIRSIRAGRMREGLRGCMRWLDRVDDSPRPARLEDFLGRYADGASPQIVARFHHAAMHGEPMQQSDLLVEQLRTARTRWLKRNADRRAAGSSLPALNP